MITIFDLKTGSTHQKPSSLTAWRDALQLSQVIGDQQF